MPGNDPGDVVGVILSGHRLLTDCNDRRLRLKRGIACSGAAAGLVLVFLLITYGPDPGHWMEHQFGALLAGLVACGWGLMAGMAGLVRKVNAEIDSTRRRITGCIGGRFYLRRSFEQSWPQA